jgi:dTDP-4-dehydrorhamnose reductase
MSRVIVFGASGLLGASLVPTLRVIGHTVITQGRGEMTNPSINPSDPASVIDSFIKHRPDVVVNLIAATNVDQCETHPQIAWKANAEVVGNLANAIVLVNEKLMIRPHLIQISTDQVYGGDGPHCEDNVQPINVYGLSKYSGELLAMRVAATVLRTNFFGKSRRTGRVSLSDWLVDKLRDLNSITVFDDVMFSAIHIDSLCCIIARCIELCPVGIFNVGCRDSMSKADFAFTLANVLNLPTDNVTIGSINDVALTARRPLDMRLKVSRLENMLALQFPSILDEIHRTAMEYQND